MQETDLQGYHQGRTALGERGEQGEHKVRPYS